MTPALRPVLLQRGRRALELRGLVSMRTRRLHGFIGQAIGTRGEVFTVLALLDKPDATWDDPAPDRISGELRAEFGLVDRYTALAIVRPS